MWGELIFIFPPYFFIFLHIFHTFLHIPSYSSHISSYFPRIPSYSSYLLYKYNERKKSRGYSQILDFTLGIYRQIFLEFQFRGEGTLANIVKRCSVTYSFIYSPYFFMYSSIFLIYFFIFPTYLFTFRTFLIWGEGVGKAYSRIMERGAVPHIPSYSLILAGDPPSFSVLGAISGIVSASA